MAAAAVIQRPYRGSRVSTFYPVKTLPPLSSLDSAFQLQEYISLLIRHNVHDVERIVALPGKPTQKEKEKDTEEQVEADKAKGDVVVDEACWIYEQLRRLAQDLTHPLITMLQQECNRSTCPEMKAGEWLYLCVAHGTDGAMEQCCAIDYILHTLDSATALLNSPRAFPSRLQIPSASHRHFSSLARRLGRIFAHAYFHHRDIFAQAEAESSLYARFLALTSRYDLVPPDFIIIPSETKTVASSDGSRSQVDDLVDEDDDIPRDATRTRTVVVVPPTDPNDVEPPRLLAAALDPQAESQRLPPSVRVIANNRNNNKSRNSPASLFVSGSGLIPVSAAATTAAPTTAASLFESAAVPTATTTTTTTGEGLDSGQESPRKTGRPRTDTVIYSGTSPIPLVSLGARLNEPPEEVPSAPPSAGDEDKESTAAATPVLVPVPPVSEQSESEAETVPEAETASTAEVETTTTTTTTTTEEALAADLAPESDSDGAEEELDFEPVDDEMVVGVEQQPEVFEREEQEEEEEELVPELVVGEEEGHEELEEQEHEQEQGQEEEDSGLQEEHDPEPEGLASTTPEEDKPELDAETLTELHVDLVQEHPAAAVATEEGEKEKEASQDGGEKAIEAVASADS